MTVGNNISATQILTEINSNMPDNFAEQITPAVVRQILADISASYINNLVNSRATVTQLTSRTTGVTINSLSGAITLFTANASTSPTSFVVTNNLVGQNDVIITNFQSSSASNTYFTSIDDITNGTFTVTFASWIGTASDTPVLNFAVIKCS